MIETTILITIILIFEFGFFAVGYYIGSNRSLKTDLQTLERQVKEKGGTILLNKETPTGAIPHKTAKDIAYQKLPDKQKEGLEEMKKTLDNDPAMQEHKRLVEQLRKSGELI